MHSYEVAISRQGQLTLPRELRQRYHLLEGERALLIPEGDGVLIKHPRHSLRGAWRGKINSKAFDEELKKLRREWRL